MTSPSNQHRGGMFRCLVVGLGKPIVLVLRFSSWSTSIIMKPSSSTFQSLDGGRRSVFAKRKKVVSRRRRNGDCRATTTTNVEASMVPTEQLQASLIDQRHSNTISLLIDRRRRNIMSGGAPLEHYSTKSPSAYDLDCILSSPDNSNSSVNGYYKADGPSFSDAAASWTADFASAAHDSNSSCWMLNSAVDILSQQHSVVLDDWRGLSLNRGTQDASLACWNDDHDDDDSFTTAELVDDEKNKSDDALVFLSKSSSNCSKRRRKQIHCETSFAPSNNPFQEDWTRNSSSNNLLLWNDDIVIRRVCKEMNSVSRHKLDDIVQKLLREAGSTVPLFIAVNASQTNDENDVEDVISLSILTDDDDYHEEDNDEAYQQFLGFLINDSNREPLQHSHHAAPQGQGMSTPLMQIDDDDDDSDNEDREKSEGFVAAMVKRHEEFIKANERRGYRQHPKVSNKQADDIERYVIYVVDAFEHTMNDDEDLLPTLHDQEEVMDVLSLSEVAESEGKKTLPFQQKAKGSNGVDSAMAWCALAAVLGCPAPSALSKKGGGKKEQLWDLNTIEDIPDLPFDENLHVLSPPDLNDLSLASENSDEEDSLFIVPDVEDVSAIEKFISAFEHTMNDDEDLLPTLHDQEEVMDVLSLSDVAESEGKKTLPFQQKDKSNKGVDSAMAWCALAAVLGCPAPSALSKKGGGKKEQLWDLNTIEDIPDLPFDENLHVLSPPGLNDLSFASENSDDGNESDDEEDSLFVVPDVEDVSAIEKFIRDESSISIKDAADSTLAWSALALLLGSPLTASITRKTGKGLKKVIGQVTGTNHETS